MDASIAPQLVEPEAARHAVTEEAVTVTGSGASRHSGTAVTPDEPMPRVLEDFEADEDDMFDVDRLPCVLDFDRDASTAAGVEGSLPMPSLSVIHFDAMLRHLESASLV